MTRNILFVLLIIFPFSTAFSQSDSLQIVKLLRHAYHWHNQQVTEDKGFEPRKNRPADTVYAGIDFKSVDFMIRKFRSSGFFDESFLSGYRALAVRMDKEMKNKSVIWIEGRLPPFNRDADPWCNCPDVPGAYWQKIKITQFNIHQGHADVSWSLDGKPPYHLKALKKNGIWRISYLQGYEYRP